MHWGLFGVQRISFEYGPCVLKGAAGRCPAFVVEVGCGELLVEAARASETEGHAW
jgi:hypothetical protein